MQHPHLMHHERLADDFQPHPLLTLADVEISAIGRKLTHIIVYWIQSLHTTTAKIKCTQNH